MTADETSAMDHPEEISTRFAEAWNSADAASLAELFAHDADFVNVVGLWWEDRERIRQAHDYGFRKIFGNSAMTLERTKLRRLGESAAIVHAEWSLTGQTAQGEKQPRPRRGVFTFVMQQGDSGWLAVAAHNTDRVPGSETLIADDDGLSPTSYQNR